MDNLTFFPNLFAIGNIIKDFACLWISFFNLEIRVDTSTEYFEQLSESLLEK